MKTLQAGADTSQTLTTRVGALRRHLKAFVHERLIYIVDQPLAFLLAEVTRKLGDVVFIPGIGYVVNDPDVAKRVLLQDDAFTKSGPGSMGRIITQVMGPYALLNMDGQEHAELRVRLAGVFSPNYVSRVVKTTLDPLISELRDYLVGGKTVDVVTFMHRMSGAIICNMLGIEPAPGREEQVYDEIFELGARVTSVLRLTTMELTPAQVAACRGLTDHLSSYADDCYDHPGQRPDSLIERLREAGLNRDQAKSVVAVLLVVGIETVSTALPRILALLVDTGQLRTVQQQPDLLSAAIDEGLRCVVPSPIMLRSVAAESVVVGHRFKPGHRVMILTYNLLKSRKYFRRPLHFDIHREHDPEVKHLWFGSGPHFCIGFSLAHLELQAVLEVFVTLSKEVRIVRRRYARHVLIPAYESLCVALT